jgi:hypothetical protein
MMNGGSDGADSASSNRRGRRRLDGEGAFIDHGNLHAEARQPYAGIVAQGPAPERRNHVDGTHQRTVVEA